KDIVVHGLKKESLGQYASFFKALFPNEENNSEKTFVIEGQSTSSQVQREIKIIDKKNHAIEVKKTTQILTRYLKEKMSFNQIIKPIVYFNYSTSKQNYDINFNVLKDVYIFTDIRDITN